MSLNWNMTDCADSESLRTEETWPFTEALIFATMAIGMGTITEGNIAVFAARLQAYAAAHGYALFQRWDGERAQDRVVTVDDLRPYIGLHTNVTFESDAKFKNRMAKKLMEKAAAATR